MFNDSNFEDITRLMPFDEELNLASEVELLMGTVNIQMVTMTLLNELRETDVKGRLGGEEFVVILVDTEAEPAVQLADRLQKQRL
jgi:GGDEF domain-containing protein